MKQTTLAHLLADPASAEPAIIAEAPSVVISYRSLADQVERLAETLLGAPDASDVALLLHTSGTEGRPKIVPLTHTNVLLAAQHVASHYALTPADRSLVVMPLFHGHGLIGAALATLASGGAAIVPPRF